MGIWMTLLTPEERWNIGLKVLQRFLPGQVLPSADLAQADDAAPGGAAERLWQPTVRSLVAAALPLEPLTLIWGTCEDGLPLLLHLTVPEAGAILISGDPGCGKRRLVQAVLESAAWLHRPDELVYLVISSQAEAFALAAQWEHCDGVLAAHSPEAGQWIHWLSLTCQRRLHGEKTTPAILFVLDDLEALAAALDDENFSRLYWLIQAGAQASIFTLATISSAALEYINTQFLSVFGTWVVGQTHFSGCEEAQTEQDILFNDLLGGYEFCTPGGEGWLRFWVCEPQKEKTA